MNKKIIFGVIIVLLLLLLGGVFWWQQERIFDYLEEKELESVFALAKDFSIIETPDGKFIENKKDGFKAKAPDNWDVEIGMDMFGFESKKKVTLYSIDFNYQPPQGCLIEIQINRVKEEKEESDFIVRSIDEVKRDIILLKETGTKNRFSDREVILINGKEALKQTFILEEGRGEHIVIEIPSEERVYSFEVILFSEKCKESIEKFLETTSIK